MNFPDTSEYQTQPLWQCDTCGGFVVSDDLAVRYRLKNETIARCKPCQRRINPNYIKIEREREQRKRDNCRIQKGEKVPFGGNCESCGTESVWNEDRQCYVHP